MKQKIIKAIAGFDQFGKKVVRIGIVVVFVWIGALKFVTYEADGIVPFVANSPFMSFFYNHPSEYSTHMNKEGELIAANHEWHIANNTYGFSRGLGILLMSLGVLVALHKVAPLASMIGSILVVITTIGTLSFLITTPETWVPALGDHQSGFPYLSGRGRMVIKDILILGAAFITMSESARLYLQRQREK
jgi:uncharacterized membrane protein YkgB